jgi:hypothetical protein
VVGQGRKKKEEKKKNLATMKEKRKEKRKKKKEKKGRMKVFKTFSRPLGCRVGKEERDFEAQQGG